MKVFLAFTTGYLLGRAVTLDHIAKTMARAEAEAEWYESEDEELTVPEGWVADL